MKLYSKKNKILFLIIAVLLIFSLNFFQKEVRNFFYSFSAPLQRNLWQMGDSLSDFFKEIFGRENLKRENEELKLKNQELLSKNIVLKKTKRENEILREALGVGLGEDFDLVLAKVVGKDINQDSILINKGSKEGLTKDRPVITEQKVLLGRITEVYKDFSRVELISNKESSFDAKISEKNIDGLIRGQGSFKIYLDLIPRDKEIKEGDLIISSSLGGVFPSGLLIGVIKEVKKSDIQPFQQAEISPFFDARELENVFVILNF